MKKSKVLSIIVFMFLITSCAQSEEAPVEVFYDDVTNEQMFLNIKNNDLDEIKRFVEINRKYLNIKDENGYTPLMLSALYNQPETAKFILENPGIFINLSLIHISEPTRR